MSNAKSPIDTTVDIPELEDETSIFADPKQEVFPAERFGSDNSRQGCK